jgi:membrane protease YdiL (CAAX protease family)
MARGYMLTRLIDSSVPKPIFFSGLVWALWHVPLILSGQYASGSHPALSAVLFVGNVIGLGYVFAWLRLSSGSIWPCSWAHGVWNAVIQGPFDMSTTATAIGWASRVCLTTVTMTVFTILLSSLAADAQHATLENSMFGPLPLKIRSPRTELCS